MQTIFAQYSRFDRIRNQYNLIALNGSLTLEMLSQEVLGNKKSTAALIPTEINENIRLTALP